MFVALAAALIVLAIVAFAFTQDRRRGQAFLSLGLGLGLRYERWAKGLAEELKALPGLKATQGRHVFAHVLRSPDEVLADWRHQARPKERPRRVTQTLFAVRTAGAVLEERVEIFEDPRPSGFGQVTIESGAEWIACYVRNHRIPEGRLAEFREAARGWIDARLAE